MFKPVPAGTVSCEFEFILATKYGARAKSPDTDWIACTNAESDDDERPRKRKRATRS